MKKLFWGVILSLMTISLFAGTLMVYADDSDNFEKAGQQVLKEKEEILIQKKAATEAFVYAMPEDGVVTKDEMVALWEKFDDFFDTKAEADKYLQFYKLQTATVLDDKIKQLIKAYCFDHAIRKRDSHNEVKFFFTSYSGYDVIVESGWVIRGGEITLMIVGATGILLIAFGAQRRISYMIIGGIMLFILSSFLISV